MGGPSKLLIGLAAIAAAAAAGAVAGFLAAPPEADRGPGAAAGGAAAPRGDDARLAAFERRLTALEQRAGRGRATAGADAATGPSVPGAGAAGGESGQDGSAAAVAEGAPGAGSAGDAAAPGAAADAEFVASVRSAIAQIQAEDARAADVQRLRSDREKSLRDLDRRLAEIGPRLGLDEGTVAGIRKIAQEGIDDLLRGRARGAPAEELQAIERTAHVAARNLVGDAAYREIRRYELDAAARPQIAAIASQAGVDRDQRERVERLVADHIEGLLDDDVRVRTESLSAEDRAAMTRRADAATRALWDRIRNDVLDPAQRERVPLRVR